MTSIKSIFRKIENSGFMFPIILFVICFFAYGLLVNRLGYYFDDWPVILMIKSKLNFWEFFKLSRPFSAWTYSITAPFLGLDPLNWHIFLLFVRWITCLMAYWTLIQLWPGKKKEVMFIICLFAVYPAFWQNSISVAYSQHFITYLVYFISMGSMLAAIKKRRVSGLWFVSILTGGLHLLTMEYFWGLELVRPIFIWMMLTFSESGRKKRLFKTIRIWIPYLAILIGVILWRSLLANLPDDPNPIVLFEALSNEPFHAVINYFQQIIRDVSHILITGWYDTFQIDLIDLNLPFLIIAWVIAFCVAVIAFIYFQFVISEKIKDGGSLWEKQAVFLGIVFIILGTSPAWIVGRFVTKGMYSDRFAIPALIGASIFLVGAVSIFINSSKQQILLVSILLGLATGSQFRIANDYRWDWVNQQRVYWQMFWRAPMIEENTIIVSDGGLFKYTGEYPTANALNVLYSQRTNSFEQPYWMMELDDYYQDNGILLPNTELSFNILNISYSGLAEDSIFIDYLKDGSCLKVLTRMDGATNSLTDLFQQASELISTDRIISDVTSLPDQTVFGPEPAHTWCYLFEKAELARQLVQWQQVVDLGNQAIYEGYEVNHPAEWFVFIEGYAHTGDYEQAVQLNSWVLDRDEKIHPQLCSLWENLVSQYPSISDEYANMSQIRKSLDCNLSTHDK
ncbi:hypothetical protein ACFLTX_03505 [Chloroflexota bacterium]